MKTGHFSPAVPSSLAVDAAPGGELQLADGKRVRLRTIEPGDRLGWLDLLSRCSDASICQRFRHAVNWRTESVAQRYCCIDGEREIAVVAEAGKKGRRRIVAVGRLIADSDGRTGEFAILVADDWQHLGLGSKLTSYCILLAGRRGWERIQAHTTRDNTRMLAVLRKCGFKMRRDPYSSERFLFKSLRGRSIDTAVRNAGCANPGRVVPGPPRASDPEASRGRGRSCRT